MLLLCLLFFLYHLYSNVILTINSFSCHVAVRLWVTSRPLFQNLLYDVGKMGNLLSFLAPFIFLNLSTLSFLSPLLFSSWRVKSCLRLIAAQLHAQAVRGVGMVEADTFSTSITTSSLDMDSNVQSAKRTARRERRLHMLSCNDILSPPLWVLPLVHSPQYLAHLWDLAEEAREVPLTIPSITFLISVLASLFDSISVAFWIH